MTPQDKAKLLYELIRYDISTLKGAEALINEVAKKCSLIAVDEVLSEATDEDDLSWWKKVKQEIQLL